MPEHTPAPPLGIEGVRIIKIFLSNILIHLLLGILEIARRGMLMPRHTSHAVDEVVAEVQMPARPNNGRVRQRGDKAHWVRQCRNVVSDAALYLVGVTRTPRVPATSRQPRCRFRSNGATAPCETKRRASQSARQRGRLGATAR